MTTTTRTKETWTWSEESKARAKEKYATAEAKKVRSEATKRNWQNPEFREKRNATHRATCANRVWTKENHERKIWVNDGTNSKMIFAKDFESSGLILGRIAPESYKKTIATRPKLQGRIWVNDGIRTFAIAKDQFDSAKHIRGRLPF